MGRTMVCLLALSAVVAAEAQGQRSIGVTAVIVEPMTAVPLPLELGAEAGHVSVLLPAVEGAVDTRLLRHVYVRPTASEALQGVPAAGRRARPGRRVVEAAADLTITTVIAANS